MRTALVIYFILITLVTKGQVKIITPGEHLGFELETFDQEGKRLKMTISPGETWTAIYTDNGTFKTKTEKISWDTTKSCTIQSDTTKQPNFYVQGLEGLVSTGEGTSFDWNDFLSVKPLVWTSNKTSYTILYHRDPTCLALTAFQYKVINVDSELVLFKGVTQEQVDKLQIAEENRVLLYWVGDLNGDDEPDFLLGLKSHHEMPIYELIMSGKKNDQVIWIRIARFTEWS